jgi:hypothetical protein
MNYVLLFIFLLPTLSRAQSSVTGIGNYVIGVTTPDSLRPADFVEEDESYVKGTIALPCTHIRTFTASNTAIAGISVHKAVLVFYDNTLFKISCDLSDSLSSAFVTRYGPGIRKTKNSVQLCDRATHKPFQQWTTVWANGDVLAVMVNRSGYGADCKPDKSARLLVASQRMLALSSECDIKPADPFPEEFDRVRRDVHKTKQTLNKNP